MGDVSIDVTGVDEILEKINGLSARMQRNVVTAGMRAGARVIANDAKARASALDDPKTPQNIAKNITVRASRKEARRINGVAMQIGVMGGAKQSAVSAFKSGSKGGPGGDTWYWRLLEFGTVKMPARPFMTPAMNGKAQEAFKAAADRMQMRLDQELKKL